jgi:hypothetical protein
MFLFLFVFLMSGTAHAANECPADQPLKTKMMTPDGFRQWLKTNSEALKTVEDVVCCLPQQYLKNYVVSYSGRAGQTGSPESPRVFFYDTQKTGTTLLTFNGGDAYLNEPHNIEMAYLKEQKKFEIYDIEFYKRFAQMSEKNPVRCLRCHADINNADPRPFFHMNSLANFVTGPSTCSPDEDEIQNKAQEMALNAIVKNPRFACLDRVVAQTTLANHEKNHKWTGPFAENLKKLQAVFSRYQKSRFAQLVRASNQFNSYRFAIIGAENCPGFKPADWLPADVLAQHNSFSTLHPELAGIENQEQYQNALGKLKGDEEVRERALRGILKSEFDLKRGSFRPAFQSWLCPSDETFEKMKSATVPAETHERALAKFDLDSRLRIFPRPEHVESTAALRYLLDGRGIDTSGWTLSFNPREDLHSFEPIANELLEMEPKGSPLKEKSCEKLKQLSLRAFLPAPLAEKAH